MVQDPHAIGLPEQFEAWRPNQAEALDFLQRSTKRVRALCAATGFGKTAVVVADALLSKKPTCFVTESRALQDQYMDLYGSIGMVDLRGRANYSCRLKPEERYTCEQGYAVRCPFKGSVKCEASQAEMRAAASFLVVTNYDKWIHAKKFGQGLDHIKRVAFDEGHEGPNALGRAMQVTLHQHEIEEQLHLKFPTHYEAEFFESWKRWAQPAREKCELMMIASKLRLSGPNVKSSYVKHYTHLRHLSRRLAILATAATDNWVVDEVPKGYQFDPIEPARYSEYALLLRVPEIVVISAILRPKTLFMMGVPKKDFEFREFKSEFDAKRCPIYYVPTMRVDAKARDLSLLWMRLDQIASARRDRNGIVHSISFTRADEVITQSRFRSSMLVNERGEPATQMIDVFKDSYPGSILVSPSVGQGFDFSFKAAEWQLICKIPFPPPSKILRARTERDPEYPHYIAMQKLVNATGRIMRDKEDQGETFLVDDHLKWFLPQYGHLAPASFKQFFKVATTLPAPPRRL